MAEEDRKDAHEVQEDTYTSEEIRDAMNRNGITPEQIRMAMNKLMPEEYQQKLIHAAASASGRNEADLPIEEAIILLQANPPAREVKKILDSMSEQAGAAFLESVPDEQLKGMAADLVTGKLAPEIMDALEKVHPPKKIDVIKGHETPTIQDVQKALEGVSDLISELSQGVAPVLQSAVDAIGEQLRQVSEVWDAMRDQLPPDVLERLNAWWDEAEPLLPFIAAELKARGADYGAMTFLEEQVETDGTPKTELAAEILQAARDRRDELNDIPRIKYNPVTEVKTLTDKLPSEFFSITAPLRSPGIMGQREMIPLSYEKRGSSKPLTLFYDFSFDESTFDQFGLSKKFTHYDFFVMTALDNLKATGNEYVSINKIYAEMGGTGNMPDKNKDVLRQSLLKGLSTNVRIDDAEILREWKPEKSGTYKEIIGPLFPIEIINERYYAGGRIAETMVHIRDFSPFFRVGAPLDRLTAWDTSVLKLYTGRRTDRYYSVLHFLLASIGWMRNGDRNSKINYELLYEYTGAKAPRAKQLTKETLYRLLDEVFIPLGYVTAYKEEGAPKPGVRLNVPKSKRRITKSK